MLDTQSNDLLGSPEFNNAFKALSSPNVTEDNAAAKIAAVLEKMPGVCMVGVRENLKSDLVVAEGLDYRHRHTGNAFSAMMFHDNSGACYIGISSDMVEPDRLPSGEISFSRTLPARHVFHGGTGRTSVGLKINIGMYGNLTVRSAEDREVVNLSFSARGKIWKAEVQDSSVAYEGGQLNLPALLSLMTTPEANLVDTNDLGFQDMLRSFMTPPATAPAD